MKSKQRTCKHLNRKVITQTAAVVVVWIICTDCGLTITKSIVQEGEAA